MPTDDDVLPGSSDASYAVYAGELPVPVNVGFYYPFRTSVTLDCGDVMITKQEFAAECDIQNILKQFSKTGILEHINAQEAAWLDLPDQMDYQQSLNILEQANAAFESLPSIVREKYHNSPAEFLGALSDPAQKDYLTEVGIFAPAWAKQAGGSESPTSPPADVSPTS